MDPLSVCTQKELANANLQSFICQWSIAPSSNSLQAPCKLNHDWLNFAAQVFYGKRKPITCQPSLDGSYNMHGRIQCYYSLFSL